MTVRLRIVTVLEWLPALVVFALVVGLWEGLVRALHVQHFLLPKPSTIVSAFWT